MVYKPRNLIHKDGSIFQVCWGFQEGSLLFKDAIHKNLYYQLLHKYQIQYDISFHSYCFLDDQVYLTGILSSQDKFSKFFRLVNSLFSKSLQKFLKDKDLKNTERFKSSPLSSQKELLEVMVQDNLRPCREGIVENPAHYPFSSYRHYAMGKEDLLLIPPPSYLELGNNPRERQKKYQDMVALAQKKDEGLKNFSWLSDSEFEGA